MQQPGGRGLALRASAGLSPWPSQPDMAGPWEESRDGRGEWEVKTQQHGPHPSEAYLPPDFVGWPAR